MASVWTRGVSMPRFEPLRRDMKTDVLVIGGGMAGLLCAWKLTEAGMDCTLVEGRTLCGGITQNTTAKVTAHHGLVYDKLLRRFGAGRARLYLEANLEALETYKGLARAIDCDFEERDSCVYTTDDREKLEREAAALDKLGHAADLVEELPLPIPTAGGIRFRGQGQFHPLKFAAAMAQGLRIYEHTKVVELRPGAAVTPEGRIEAERMVVATHFPFLNKHGGYFLKLYQHRSHLLALEGAPPVDRMYVDGDETGLSFRQYGRLLLLGGGGHRTGKRGGGWQALEEVVRRHYPAAREAARWAAQDCMSLDGIPYVGEYSRGTNGLYVATGFNKWGMTSAMAAATLLTDLLRGRDNPYASVFSPSRGMLRPQLAVNTLESAVGLLTPTAPRCPHLGCALKYNEAERSWDCPCHGSRFAEDGRLIDNPATDDKRM